MQFCTIQQFRTIRQFHTQMQFQTQMQNCTLLQLLHKTVLKLRRNSHICSFACKCRIAPKYRIAPKCRIARFCSLARFGSFERKSSLERKCRIARKYNLARKLNFELQQFSTLLNFHGKPFLYNTHPRVVPHIELYESKCAMQIIKHNSSTTKGDNSMGFPVLIILID